MGGMQMRLNSCIIVGVATPEIIKLLCSCTCGFGLLAVIGLKALVAGYS